ncbi:MAG: hypothetical protein ACWIPH_06510, partial [Ostreibacterium sp.]
MKKSQKRAFSTKKTSIAKVIDQHKASLGMQLASALGLGVTVVLGLSTPAAMADCIPFGAIYTCSGSTTTPQTLTALYNTVDIEASTDIDTTGSGSFAISAIEGFLVDLTINQAAGSKLKGDTQALFINTDSATTNVEVDLSGEINGGTQGISAIVAGTLEVTTGDTVTGTSAEGIFTRASGTTITADGDVTGGTQGISVINDVNDADVTTTGSVTGNNGD